MPTALTTQLMFTGQAEEAMNFYVALLGGQVHAIERYTAGQPGAEGTVKRAEFTIAGHRLACIDSPPMHAFTFTPSMSLFVDFADEDELTSAYAKLAEGGQVLMPLDNYGFSRSFGFVSDRFGVSWQLNLP